MSTIVCQNLVSCFESHLTETTTTLKLKVAAAPPPPQPPPAIDDRRNLDFGNWGFLQTNPEKSGDAIDDDKSTTFCTKKYYSKLSPKSLELCTENLGSETGTDIVSDGSSIFSSSPPLSPTGDFPSPRKADDWEQRPRYPYHKCRKIMNFPPPLTSSNSLQVRHHREGGRLIIEAVEAPFRNSFLQAERSDGRLRLCFLTTADAAETTTSAADEEEEECGEETAADVGPSINDVEFDDEINLEIEMEKEKEKLKRLSRCKEGGHGSKGLCSNWKPALWVATS